MSTSLLKSVLSLHLLIQVALTSPSGQLEYAPHNFFNEDVTSVIWAHAVNSQEELDATLSNPLVRMIEGDLCRGRLNSSGQISPWDMVIMGHPPTNISDLSFTSFIDQVIEFNRGKEVGDMKGVKLDFKDYFSATRSVLLLKGRNDSSNGTALRFPVWLNADVVKGPVDSDSEPGIKGVDLLRLHDLNLPNAILSLGWTTRFGKQGNGEVISEGNYSRSDIDAMIQVFTNYSIESGKPSSTIPVTFAVRAALGQNSLGNLLYLLHSLSPKASITFWAGADDPKVDVVKMDDFVKVVGKRRTFVDLPYEDWRKSGGQKRGISGGLFVGLIFIMQIFLHG